MRPFSRAVSLEKPHVPYWYAKGYLTPLIQLRTLPEIPVPTREEPQVSCHNSRRAPFSPYSNRDEGRFPCLVGKGIQHCCRLSGGCWSPLETRAHPQKSCLNSKIPQFLHPLQVSMIPLHWLDWNPEDRLKTRREGWQPCGTSRKSRRILCPLNRKPDTSFTPWEGSGVPCLHMRRGLTPLLKLHRNPEIHVRTEEAHWGSSLNSGWGPMPLHRLERNPERPLTTWMETWHSWGHMSRSLRSPLQFERNSKCLAATQET